MSTNQAQQAAETRTQLLQTARRLFAVYGYAGTSMRMLSRSIGKADGIMYHYFPGGKSEIYQTLLQESMHQICQNMQQSQAEYAILPLQDALERIFSDIDAVITENLDLLRILCRDEKARVSVERQHAAGILHERQQWLPNFLRSRAEKGEIHPMDYDCAALELLAILTNHFLQVISEFGHPPLADYSMRQRFFAHLVTQWKYPNPIQTESRNNAYV